ncbi:AI-2E family transporter [Mariniphaga sp.]|uniref:AI-2E family transporter n=1 Tax=Mariniphaga sp. TaxID=1954475 RepID=UPI0035643B2F
MIQKPISFQRLANLFLVIVLGFIILKQGKFFLGPLAFSILFTIMLQPLSHFFQRLVKYKIPAILLTLLTVTVGLSIVVTLFSVQLTVIINDLENITGKISEGLQKIFEWLNTNFKLKSSFDMNGSNLMENIPQLADNTLAFAQKGISSVTTFIFNLFLILLLVFFFLWYQENFKKFLLIQAPKEKKENINAILQKIQGTIQKYLYGLLIVIAILAVLNSVGLLIIGVRYAVFWGLLAAFLAVIPYIGTTLGGTLPFLYALATTDTWWQPAAVAAMYFIIQQLEGNIITPKVVGSSVSINPLFALIAIILGGFIWGITGILIAIPAIGVVKIILDNNNRTKPLAFLLSNEMHKKNETFWKKMDKEEHRLK